MSSTWGGVCANAAVKHTVSKKTVTNVFFDNFIVLLLFIEIENFSFKEGYLL